MTRSFLKKAINLTSIQNTSSLFTFYQHHLLLLDGPFFSYFFIVCHLFFSQSQPRRRRPPKFLKAATFIRMHSRALLIKTRKFLLTFDTFGAILRALRGLALLCYPCAIRRIWSKYFECPTVHVQWQFKALPSCFVGLLLFPGCALFENQDKWLCSFDSPEIP